MSTKEKRTYVFIDGQNFYLSARAAFKLNFPNFDARAVGDLLAQKIGGADAAQVYFYTGMPVAKYSPHWHKFWSNKIAALEEAGVHTFTRPLRYLTETDPSQPTGYKILNTREKGIDLRIALDVMEAARRPDCTDIMIVSRDQDFYEVVEKIDHYCKFEGRDIEVWSAYPDGGNGPKHLRGIDGTRQLRILRDDYKLCIDPTDYRNTQKREPQESIEPA